MHPNRKKEHKKIYLNAPNNMHKQINKNERNIMNPDANIFRVKHKN